ncbi:MAG: DUF2797 domain-containing protein [Asgard group archaeon]|nr:DUF2797 domain-containing protein [Asgard group archaeon]
MNLKIYIINAGWKIKPETIPYIAYITKERLTPEILELKVDTPLAIQVSANEPKFCVGFTNDDGEHVPCPTAEMIPLNKVQCQTCSLNEFYICRSYCIGDFCHPSSEKAKVHCWKTSAYVYVTYIAGKFKIGSSTSPIRRWITQGSDAGIKIARGVGLEPRALEQQLSAELSLSLAIRMSQKFKQIGILINKADITNQIESILDKMYNSITTKSKILIPRRELENITYLDNYYGKINQLKVRPLIKNLTNKGLKISGNVVGVKGSILVLKNNETYYATNLNSLIGLHQDLKNEVVPIKGQKSLFDFV